MKYMNSDLNEHTVHSQYTKQALLTHSENRIRARASLRRIKLSICLGVAVITCCICPIQEHMGKIKTIFKINSYFWYQKQVEKHRCQEQEF